MTDKKTSKRRVRRLALVLQRKYAMSLEDVGLTEEEWLERWDDEEESAEEVVDTFARKYALISTDRWNRLTPAQRRIITGGRICKK